MRRTVAVCFQFYRECSEMQQIPATGRRDQMLNQRYSSSSYGPRTNPPSSPRFMAAKRSGSSWITRIFSSSFKRYQYCASFILRPQPMQYRFTLYLQMDLQGLGISLMSAPFLSKRSDSDGFYHQGASSIAHMITSTFRLQKIHSRSQCRFEEMILTASFRSILLPAGNQHSFMPLM